MDLAKKYRWAVIGFILMVILNLGTLVTIWWIRPPFHFRRTPERVERFLERELDLSDQQKREFHELREKQFRQNRQIMGDIRRLRGEYFDLLEKPVHASAQAKMDSITTLIGQKRVQLEKTMYDHLFSMRKLLDEDQQRKFGKIIEQSLHGPERNESVPEQFND